MGLVLLTIFPECLFRYARCAGKEVRPVWPHLLKSNPPDLRWVKPSSPSFGITLITENRSLSFAGFRPAPRIPCVRTRLVLGHHQAACHDFRLLVRICHRPAPRRRYRGLPVRAVAHQRHRAVVLYERNAHAWHRVYFAKPLSRHQDEIPGFHHSDVYQHLQVLCAPHLDDDHHLHLRYHRQRIDHLPCAASVLHAVQFLVLHRLGYVCRAHRRHQHRFLKPRQIVCYSGVLAFRRAFPG